MKESKNLINGSWIAGDKAEHNINPSNLQDIIGTYHEATADQTDAAVDAAKEAFPGWAHSNPQTRHAVLKKIATDFSARLREIAILLSREQGKPLRQSTVDFQRAVQALEFFAGECLLAVSRTLPSTDDKISIEVTRTPIGVVGVIPHWSSPMANVIWKVAAALAYGNCVVLNADEHYPASACAIGEMINRSGIPPGVFSLVIGSEAKEALELNQDLEGLSFMGSSLQCMGLPASSMGFYKYQADGGRNIQIVLDDANLEQTVEWSVQNALQATLDHGAETGEIIVTEGIYPRLLQAVKERISRMKVGDALATETDLGPRVSECELNDCLDVVARAKREGATIAMGGNPVACHTGSEKKGYFMAPTVITDWENSDLHTRGLFGPVVNVRRVRNFANVLEMVNRRPGVLIAGIATQSVIHAKHFERNCNARMFMTNIPKTGLDYSSMAYYRNAMEFFSEAKIAFNPVSKR